MLEQLVANFAAARLERDRLKNVRDTLFATSELLEADYPTITFPGAIPSSSFSNSFGTNAENILQIAAMMGQVRAAAQSDLDLTCQGMIGASASSLAPGSGVQVQVGMFMISGDIEFCDPYGDGVGYDTVNDSAPLNPAWVGYSTAALNDYGDPLDALYPSETARHPGRDAAEKNSYLWRNWDDSDMLVAESASSRLTHLQLIKELTGHDLAGQFLFARSTIEEHAHQIQCHKALTAACTSFRKSARFLAPTQTATAECDEQDGPVVEETAKAVTTLPKTRVPYESWVQVEREVSEINPVDAKKVAAILQKMAALTAAQN